MARKIRFPLKMKNSAEVRTLDELKENFDLESVLGYFTDGKLTTWLADRYYDEKAEAVSALSSEMPDLSSKLCEILEVEYHPDEDDKADVEVIARRREKLHILSSVTDDKEVLDSVDLVAFTQDELFDILDEQPEKVYLYGEKFEIPFGKKNITYIGLNSPTVVLEKDKGTYLYSKAEINFINVSFESGVNRYFTIGEKLFIEGKFKEAFPLIEQAANNGNPRAMYIMACYYVNGYSVVIINQEESNNWCKKAYSFKEPLSMYGYALWCLENGSDEGKNIFKLIYNDIQLLAESSDPFAQQILGLMYFAGEGVSQDYAEAVKWFHKAAEQDDAFAQCLLGYVYSNGEGVSQDYAEAIKWFSKAAEQGIVSAQSELGYMYEKGMGVSQDYAEAVKWFRKAAEQGDKDAQNKLNELDGNVPIIRSAVPQNNIFSFDFLKAAEEEAAKEMNNSELL